MIKKAYDSMSFSGVLSRFNGWRVFKGAGKAEDREDSQY